MTPFVTVGVTCYNAAETILRALNSAFNQDWPNFEVLIVDDCSTDASHALVTMAIAHESRAKLICHSRNLGVASARNSILAQATGEFIAFFDDDDESLSNRVTEQVNTILSYEGLTGTRLIACYASGVRRYPNGYTMPLPAIGSRGDESPQGPGLAEYLLTYRRRPGWFYGSGTPTCALMARRSTFLEVGKFDVALRRLEDGDFAIRLALMGGHFIGTQRVLFTQYPTSAADKSPERSLKAYEHIAYKHKRYLKSIRRFEYAKRWPRLRYWHYRRRYHRFALELLILLALYPLAVSHHLLITGPRRFWHERRMMRKTTVYSS